MINACGRHGHLVLQVDGTQNMEEVFNSIDKHLVKLADSTNQVVAS